MPTSGSLNFTEETIPLALREEHSLAADHWGVLHVFAGNLRFVSLPDGDEREVSAPDLVVIHPEVPHKVEISGTVRCRIDFFRRLGAEATMRTPGAFADEDVRRSFARCEQAGDFPEVFYRRFLTSSPRIAPHFAETDFEMQRKVLRDSVYLMVHRDAGDPDMREMLDRLGYAHGRRGRNIPPDLYELWLDSICAAVKELDPEWSDELDRKWRVRMRAGMQVVMAAY